MTIGAVILAAGFGTRLAPLTDDLPKPLLDVGGRPVMDHLLDQLAQLTDLAEIVVVVNDRHPNAWQLWLDTVERHSDVRVVSNGVRTDAERAGAVADLSLAVDALGEHDWLFVLAGDNLVDEPLEAHLAATRRAGQPSVLCRDLGEHVPAGRFGEITVDDAGVITRFREKPAQPESALAATCSYVLPGSIGVEIDEYLDSGDPDSPGSFIAWLAARRPVRARPLTGRYFDIGNHETLAAARAAFGTG